MNEGQEIITPCGCHIFVDHQQGDRVMKCDHLNKWIIRATVTTSTTYTVANHHSNKVANG